jgi:hypothetical protein
VVREQPAFASARRMKVKIVVFAVGHYRPGVGWTVRVRP